MLRLPKDLREFAELLAGNEVRYLVIGGYAVAFHGYPRFTGDIDFWIEPSPDNAERIVRVLNQFGFGSLGLKPEDFLQPDVVIQLGNPPNRIDLLTQVKGLAFEDAWGRREIALLDGLPLCLLDREALIASKKAAGRAKDKLDVRVLQRRAAK